MDMLSKRYSGSLPRLLLLGGGLGISCLVENNWGFFALLVFIVDFVVVFLSVCLVLLINLFLSQPMSFFI